MKFIFSNFQTYSRQLYHQINSFTGIFDNILSPPHALPMYWLKRSHQILNSSPPPPNGGSHSSTHVLRSCGKAWEGGATFFEKTVLGAEGGGGGTTWEDTKTWNFQSCFSDRMHDFLVIIPRCYKILKILAQLDSRILCL